MCVFPLVFFLFLQVIHAPGNGRVSVLFFVSICALLPRSRSHSTCYLIRLNNMHIVRFFTIVACPACSCRGAGSMAVGIVGCLAREIGRALKPNLLPPWLNKPAEQGLEEVMRHASMLAPSLSHSVVWSLECDMECRGGSHELDDVVLHGCACVWSSSR